jgi:hypothetical protein
MVPFPPVIKSGSIPIQPTGVRDALEVVKDVI